MKTKLILFLLCLFTLSAVSETGPKCEKCNTCLISLNEYQSYERMYPTGENVINVGCHQYKFLCNDFKDYEVCFSCNIPYDQMFMGSRLNANTSLKEVLYINKLVREDNRQISVDSKQQNTITSEVSNVIMDYVNNMVYVEGGMFDMGAHHNQRKRDFSDMERPLHKVILKDYFIGETEVTQALWQAIMNYNPSSIIGNSLPVDNIMWYDCQEFIKRFNNITGKNFRLPTEAEWEYAARGGIESKNYKYSGSNTLSKVAWYWDNSDGHIQNVKSKEPNELGIYDMSGNVWEWCQDWIGLYSPDFQADPFGPNTGSRRVVRGGSCCIGSDRCRSCYRMSLVPDDFGLYVGFRLVCAK